MNIVWIFLVLVAGTTSALPLWADSPKGLEEEVQKEVRAGKLLSSSELLERYHSELSGKLLDIEVERKRGRILYEFEVLKDDGVVIEVKIDAKSGEWLGEEREE